MRACLERWGKTGGGGERVVKPCGDTVRANTIRHAQLLRNAKGAGLRGFPCTAFAIQDGWQVEVALHGRVTLQRVEDVDVEVGNATVGNATVGEVRAAMQGHNYPRHTTRKSVTYTQESLLKLKAGPYDCISACTGFSNDHMVFFWSTTAMAVYEFLPGKPLAHKRVLEQYMSPQVLLDLAVKPDEGGAVFALLLADYIEVWDLTLKLSEPVLIVNLASIVPKLDLDARIKGASAFNSEHFMCLTWAGDNLMLGGQKIWLLSLDENPPVAVARWPSCTSDLRVRKRLMWYTDYQCVDDYAITCMTSHPNQPTLLCAVSATRQEALLFDLTESPMLPLAVLPLPDCYDTQAAHCQVLWLSADQVAHLDITDVPDDRNSYILVSALQSRTSGCRTLTPCFTIPPLDAPSAAWEALPSFENLDNPFMFCFYEYSRWTDADAVHPVPGLIRPVGDIGRRALLSHRLTTHTHLTFIEDDSGALLAPQSKADLDSGPAVKSLIAMLEGGGDEDEASDTERTGTLVSGGLGALDACSLRCKETSWTELRAPGVLTIPRPICPCNTDSFTVIEHDYALDASHPDVIGPLDGQRRWPIALSAEAEAPPAITKAEDEGEAAGVIGLTQDDEGDAFDILQFPDELVKADEGGALLYCTRNKRCLWAPARLHDVGEPEEGTDPPLKVTLAGLGLPVNKHLVNALIESWPDPLANEPPAEMQSAPLIANVETGMQQRTRQAEEHAETLYSIFHHPQMNDEEPAVDDEWPIAGDED